MDNTITLRSDKLGQINIADNVIVTLVDAIIANIDGAVLQKNGILTRKLFNKNSKSSKCCVEFFNEECLCITIDLKIGVGFKINDIVAAIQNAVKTSVENMTNLSVDKVNINITGIQCERDRTNNLKNFKKTSQPTPNP